MKRIQEFLRVFTELAASCLPSASLGMKLNYEINFQAVIQISLIGLIELLSIFKNMLRGLINERCFFVLKHVYDCSQ